MKTLFTHENFLFISGVICLIVVIRAAGFLRGREASRFREDMWEDPLWGSDRHQITDEQRQKTVDYIALEAPEEVLEEASEKPTKKKRRHQSAPRRHRTAGPNEDTYKIYRTPNFSGRPHEVLGVTQNATKAQIMGAYKHWIKRYHPDRVQHLGPAYVKQANQRAEQLNEARIVLIKRFS